jgi:hypothetical protein
MPEQMVFLTYTPRELDKDDYAEFIREIDYPAFRQNPHVPEYTCWRAIESVQGREMFSHFDLMKIHSLDHWESILTDPVVKGNIERWTRDWSQHGSGHPDPAENLQISFCQMYEG